MRYRMLEAGDWMLEARGFEGCCSAVVVVLGQYGLGCRPGWAQMGRGVRKLMAPQ